MEAKVSIIVPVYNVESYFKQCVDSIRNQTIKEIEIILIDDGSPDNCPQMCDQFAAEDNRILVVHQDNAGVSVARNRGMELATADFIMFVDSDDWLESNAVEILYGCAHRNDCDIVCATTYRDYIDYQVIENIEDCEAGTYFVQQSWEYILRRIFFFQHGKAALQTSGGKFFRKSCIQNGHCFFRVGLKKAEDGVFNLYAFQAAKNFCILDVPLYHYRYRSDSVSNKILANEWEERRRWRYEVRIFLETSHLWDKYHHYYNYTFIECIFNYIWLNSLRITGINMFFEELYQIEQLAKEKKFSEAIWELPMSFMPDTKSKIKLCLLRCRMYWAVLLIFLAKNRFKELMNKRDPYDPN